MKRNVCCRQPLSDSFYNFTLLILSGFAATAFAFVEGAKGQDRNYQLKNGGVMTDVVSSSMAGTRVSGFGVAIVGNQERAKSLARPAVSGEPTKAIFVRHAEISQRLVHYVVL